jgi:SM-20-related protein
MTAQELFTDLSEVLVKDEEILDVGERELISNVLQRAHSGRQEQDDAVLTIIARAVGETIAQRATARLGSSITEEILRTKMLRIDFGAKSRLAVQDPERAPKTPPPLPQPLGPRPPSPGPPSPGISHVDSAGPRPPSPGPPSPRSALASGRLPASTGVRPSWTFASESRQVAMNLMPAVLPATCVVLDEFLMPADVDSLLQYTLEREKEFLVSEVVSPGVSAGAVNHEHRRSRVLYDLGAPGSLLVQRVQDCLPLIVSKLEREMFAVSRIEAQLTASNNGDFFRWHCDDGEAEVARREVTFVYFFHREPKEFSGGELLLHRSLRTVAGYVPAGEYRAIIPQQNQLVAFLSSLAHEIAPVECGSGAFEGSRFTVNGWFHR